MSSIAEKRERCRNLQAELAAIKKEAPNPGEVTGALASELEPLATLYTSLIERLPRLLELTNDTDIHVLNAEEVHASASAQVLMMEAMPPFRSVPMAKETLVHMQRIAATAKVAESWIMYRVVPQLVTDYLGTTVPMPAGVPPAPLSDNPKFYALLQVVATKKSDLDALLGEAQHRHNMVQRLTRVGHILHTAMGNVGERTALLSAEHNNHSATTSATAVDVEYTKAVTSGALEGYQTTLRELSDIMGLVVPHIPSLHYAPDLVEKAETAQNVVTLLEYYCECLSLCRGIVSSSARLGSKWMPVDVQPTMLELLKQEEDAFEMRGSGTSYRFVDLLDRQDSLVTALFTLRDAESAVEDLRRNILTTFPRLSQLPMDTVETMIGAAASGEGGVGGNTLFNGIVRETCFNGWKRFVYHDQPQLHHHHLIIGIESTSGEFLRFLDPVQCGSGIRADVCLANVLSAAHAALGAQLERGAKHSHQVVVGASSFRVPELLNMTYQAAHFTLLVLWTNLAEGAFLRTTAPDEPQQQKQHNESAHYGGASEPSSPSRPPSRATAATPLSPPSSSGLSSSLMHQTLQASSTKWAMQSSSRPESSAKSRVESITRVADPRLLNILEPRLGSASPNIFKKPKDTPAAPASKKPTTSSATPSKKTAAATAPTTDASKSSGQLLSAMLLLDDNIDDDLSAYLPDGTDEDGNPNAQPVLPCVTRDRVLSSIHKSEEIVPLLWGVLKDLVDEKHKARCVQSAAATSAKQHGVVATTDGEGCSLPPPWWFDRLAEWVYQLARSYHLRVRHLTVHDPAWHREPRAYMSRGKATTGGGVRFELGPMTFEHALEFYGGVDVPFVLTPLLHETWCKLATGLMCQETLRPTCLIGGGDQNENYESKVFLIRALLANTGRYASYLVCHHHTSFETIVNFLANQTGVVGALGIVCDIHRLASPVQVLLAQALDGATPQTQAQNNTLTSPMKVAKKLSTLLSKAEQAQRSIRWELVIFTGGSSPLDCHGALQPCIRCSHVSSAPSLEGGTINTSSPSGGDDDIGLVLEAWMASNGLPADVVPVMAQRLLVLSSLMRSICRVTMDRHCLHRAIIAAGMTLRRDGASITPDAALLHAIRQELAPTQLPQHKDFFDTVGRGLFSSEANTVFFPQVVEAARAAIHAEGLDGALETLSPTILQLHSALSSAALSGATICIVGPSCSGKSTVVKIARAVCVSLADTEGNAKAIPTMRHLCAIRHRDPDEVRRLLMHWLGLSQADQTSVTTSASSASVRGTLWLRVHGVLSKDVQRVVEDVLHEHKNARSSQQRTVISTAIVIVEADNAESPVVQAWTHSIVVPVGSGSSTSSHNDGASPVMWLQMLQRTIQVCLLPQIASTTEEVGASTTRPTSAVTATSSTSPLTPTAMMSSVENDIVALFLRHFEDALLFSFASRRDGAVVVPYSRMIQNSIILFTEVLVAHVEQKRDPQQSRTPAAPATLFLSARQLERVFWFCCTWGMESDKERTGWDAFVFSRLQQSSASVHHLHQDDSAEGGGLGVDATTPMNHHRLRRGVSPIQSRPSSAAAAAQLLVSPLRSRCVSPLSGSAMDDASIAQHDGEDDEGALYPPGGIPLHACGLDFATLQWASWTDASESCFPILFPTSAASSSATISNSTMWRSLWKSNTIIAALTISSLYLRHHRHHRRALRRRQQVQSNDGLLPLPASVKSPPLLAFCGPSATGKTLLASVVALQAHVTAHSEDPSTAASSGGGYYEILSTRCLDSARADSIYRELDAAPSGGGGGPFLILDGETLPSSEESQHHHHIDAFDVLLANVFHCHSGPGDLARDYDDADEQKHSSNGATTTTPPLHTDGLSHHQAVQKKNKKDGVVIVSRNATRIASMCPTIFIRAEQLQDERGDAAGAADTFGAKLAECLRPVAQVGGVLYRHVPLYQFTSVRRWASAHAVLRALSDSSHPTTTFYALLMQHWSSCCHDSRELMALDQLLLQVFSVVDPSHNVVLHDDEHGELGAMEESRAIHTLREAASGASSPQYAVAAPIISSSSATTQDDDPAAGSRPLIHEQLPIASLVTSTSAKRISAMYCLLSSVSAGGVWLTAPTSWKSVTTVVNIGAGNTDDDATTTLESGVVPPQAAVEIPQHQEGGGASGPEVVTTDVAANAHGTSASPTASSTAAATPVPPTSTSPTPLSTTTGAGSPISGAAASPVTNASSEDPTTSAQQSPTVKSITTTDVNVVGDVVGELCILSQLLHVELFYVTSPMSVSQGVEERMEDVDDATSLPSRPSSAGLRSNQHQLQRSNSAMGSLSSTPLPHNADASVTSLRLPGSLAAAMKTAPSSGPVYWIPAGEIRSQEDATAVEHAMLRGVRIVIDAVRHHHHVAEEEEAWGCGGDDEPHNTSVEEMRFVLSVLQAKCHPILMRTTLSDVTSIVSSVMEDADTAESIAKLISAATSRLPSKAAPSTRDVLFAVGGVEVARKEMEKSLDERIFRCSSVIQFLRRVELAIGGKSIIPAAEQQFEIREETSNRALTGSIQFFNVPPKSVRLIAQFTINYDEGKLQDISGPSVFFGTTREDVVSIPAVNGGTCRARLDAKAGGLLITTGVLDFQLSPVRYQPLILEGTVTDPAASHAVVGKVLLQQVVEEGENVYNKNWLRFGPTNTNKPTSAHNNDNVEDDPSFYQNNNSNNNSHANKHDMYALSHPESVPGEEDLQMNRIDTDRYVSRVGSMCKTLQTQLEQLVLQKVFQERNDAPKLLAGQVLVPSLIGLSLEERDRVVEETKKTSALQTMESPLTLRGLAALLQVNLYELELWLIEERGFGLPYGYLAEQNACTLRHAIERQLQELAHIKRKREFGGDDADDGVEENGSNTANNASGALKPIVLLDDDDVMMTWARGYCARRGNVVIEHHLHGSHSSTKAVAAKAKQFQGLHPSSLPSPSATGAGGSAASPAADTMEASHSAASMSTNARSPRATDAAPPATTAANNTEKKVDTTYFAKVFLCSPADLSPSDCSSALLISTTQTKSSITSLYQMRVARPEPKSNTELSVRATIQAAVDAQRTLRDSLDELLLFLHNQFAASEEASSLVKAIIEMGKERVPALMEGIRKTKDLLAAADSYVDRSGSRWKSVMDNALPHARRVALLHTSTLEILPTLSPSYGFSDAFAASVAASALAVSGKGVVELATKVFVTQVMRMVRLEHRLGFAVCLAAKVTRSVSDGEEGPSTSLAGGRAGSGAAAAKSKTPAAAAKRPTSALPDKSGNAAAAAGTTLAASAIGASNLLGASEFSFQDPTEGDDAMIDQTAAGGAMKQSVVHPFLVAMRAMRTADVRAHVQRERQLRLAAVANFDAYKQYLASLPPPTNAKAKAAAAKEPKKELKDFLSPAIKPQFPFMTYGTWVKILALTDSVPAFNNLASNMQFVEPSASTAAAVASGKGAAATSTTTSALRQEKWADWAHNPTITNVPTYEKDPTVTSLDKLLLVHVMRPERTTAAALQFVADVLGSEIPDPLSLDDVPQFLATVSTSTSTAILFRPAEQVNLIDTLSSAAFMRVRQAQTKQRRESLANNSTQSDALRSLVRNSGHKVVVRLSVEGSRISQTEVDGSQQLSQVACWAQLFKSSLINAVERNQWVLIDDVESHDDDANEEEAATVASMVSEVVEMFPEYAGMIVVVLDVTTSAAAARTMQESSDPRRRQSRQSSSPKTGNGGRQAASVLATAWPRVSCGEPFSVRARLRRMYEGSNRFQGDNLYRTLTATEDVTNLLDESSRGNHAASVAILQRNTFLISFLVAAVAQRCRYAHVAFSEPEKLANIDADVHAAMTFLWRRRIPAHSTKHWDELRNLTRDIVGASIRDPRDKAVVMAMIDWLIHPDVVSEEQLGFLQLPSGPTLDAHLQAIDQLSSVDAAEHLGFHANEERLVCEREGRSLVALIDHALSAPSSGGAPYSRAGTIAAIAMQLASSAGSGVPVAWSANDLLSVRSAAAEYGTALSKVLQQEVDALHDVLGRIHSDLRRACASDPDTIQSLEALTTGATPSHWLRWTHGACALPHRAEALPVWLESLKSRNHQLVEWARNGLPRIIALGCFQSPLGFIQAFVFDACVQDNLNVTEHHAKLTVVPPSEAQVLPELQQPSINPFAEGIYLVGFALEGGALNPVTGVIEDPPDLLTEWWRESKYMIPLVHLTLERQAPSYSGSGGSGGMWGVMSSSSHGGSGAAGGLSGRLARIQEAISFSRTNVAITKQRPSSAMGIGGGGSSSLTTNGALAPLSLLSGGGYGDDDNAPVERSQSAMGSFLPSSSTNTSSPLRRHAQYFTMCCPLFHSSLRTQDSYICDVVLASRQEPNYWLIRGTAIICEA